MLLLVMYAHICFNTHFPFCVCIYLKHKHRKYAPQRLSRNNSCQIMLRTDFVRNGHHWNWADCYGREESIRCKNSSRAYIWTKRPSCTNKPSSTNKPSLAGDIFSLKILVYTLDATFATQFWWNVVRLFVLTISRPSLNIGHVGSKTRSPGQIFGNSCLHCRGYLSDPILMKLSQNVCFDNIQAKFEYVSCGVKN